jgi:hypothetical protein
LAILLEAARVGRTASGVSIDASLMLRVFKV